MTIKVLVFGSPPIFARREGAECDARGSHSWSPWDEVWPRIGVPHFGEKQGWWGQSCRAHGDAQFRRLDAATLHFVNRWDMVPRVHFLPHILSQEGGKNLVPAFTRLVASRIGGYAARFGGYITDALSLPQNFNRTMQGKRATLDLYKQLGEFVLFPPGIVCGSKQVSATAVLPGLEGMERRVASTVGGRAAFHVAGVENQGEQPLHALALDHAKYRDALKNHRVMREVLGVLCMQEWNVTCEALAGKFGRVQGGALTDAQYELLEDWRERARERQNAEEERRKMAVEREKEKEMERMGRQCETVPLHPWCILGGSDALVLSSWALREQQGDGEGGDDQEDAAAGEAASILGMKETLERVGATRVPVCVDGKGRAGGEQPRGVGRAPSGGEPLERWGDGGWTVH